MTVLRKGILISFIVIMMIWCIVIESTLHWITFFSSIRGPKGVWTLEAKGEKPDVNISFNDAMPTKTHMALAKLVQVGKKNSIWLKYFSITYGLLQLLKKLKYSLFSKLIIFHPAIVMITIW